MDGIENILKDAGLQVILCAVYLLAGRRLGRATNAGKLVFGLVFGLISAFSMTAPLHAMPGIVLDGRSVTIGLAGAFGGPIASIVSAVVACAAQLAMGGPLTLRGCGLILSSALLGAIFFRQAARNPGLLSPLHLYLFGVAVNLLALPWLSNLPAGGAAALFPAVALPVFAILPLTTLLIGRMIVEQDRKQVFAIGEDITGLRKHEREILRLNRFYSALSQVNQAILRRETEDELLPAICRVMVEQGEFRLVAIAQVDPASRQVRFVGRAGNDPAYLDEIAISTGDDALGNGPLGVSIREDRSDVCHDIMAEPRMAPWAPAARRFGLRSAASFPIRFGGAVWGALCVYESDPGMLRAEEVRLLEEVAGDISFALENLARDRDRRRAVAALLESEERYRFLFERNPHPMWISHRESQEILDVNEAAVEFYGYSRAEFLRMTVLDLIESGSESAGSRGTFRQRKKDGTPIDVDLIRRDIDRGAAPARLTLARDVTDQRRSEETILRLNRVYAVLSNINQAIVRIRDRQALFNEACRIAVHDGGFYAACIAMRNEATGRILPVAVAGVSEIAVAVDLDEAGDCWVVGQAFRENRSVICNDLESARSEELAHVEAAESRLVPPTFGAASGGPFASEEKKGWVESALRRGCGSIAVFPLRLRGRMVGGFVHCAAAKHCFSPEEVKLLEETSADISFALEFFEEEELRRQAEAARAESELRFENAFRYAANGMALSGLDGRFLQVNSQLCALLGYSEQELLSLTVQELTHADDRAASAEFAAKAIAGGLSAARIEKRYIHKSGKPIWAWLSSAVMRDPEGRPLYFICQIQDMTERRQALQALQSSEERYRRLTENFPAGSVTTLDRDLRVAFSAGRDLERYGLDFEALRGRQLSEIVPPEVWPIVRPALEKAFQGETAVYEVPYPGGAFYRVTAAPLYAADRSIEEVMLVAANITESRRAEEAIRVNRERLRRTQAVGHVGSWEFDPASGEFWGSDECFRLFGVSEAEADLPRNRESIRRIMETCTPDWENVRKALGNLIASGGRSALEFEIHPADGTAARFVNCIAEVVPEGNSGARRVLGVIVDITERKRAADALYKSEHRLREAQAIGEIGDWEFDVPTKEMVWSEELYRLFERDPALGPPHGKQYLAMYDPEDSERMRDCGRRAIHAGESFHLDVRARLPDGRERHHHLIGRPVGNKGGLALKVHGIVQDITVRKQAEEAIRLSEQVQRRIAEQLKRERTRLIEAQSVANIGSWETDIATGKIVWSPQTFRIFETDPTEFSPTYPRFLQLVHPEDRAMVDAAFQASLLDHKPQTLEHRIVLRGARLKVVEERWQGFSDKEGRPVRAVGTCLDITERVQAREELSAALRQLNHHVAHSPLAVIQRGRDLRIERWSLRAEQLFGWRAEEVLGKTPEELALVHEEDALGVEHHVRELLLGKQDVLHVVRNRSKDGRIVYCEWYHSVTIGRDGHMASIFSIVHDITERRLAEEAMARSEEQLRALSARLETLREEERTRISREIHDELGQMLTAIKMDLRAAENNLDAFGDDRRINPVLDKLIAASELTDSTLKTMQRIAAELRPGILDKLGLAMALQHECRQFESRTGVTCRTVIGRDLPAIPPEPSTTLFRIFREALTNIARHADANLVEVELRAEPDGYCLEIRDNGKGLSAEAVMRSNSLGLLGMQERARLLKGTVSFFGGPGGGTVVSVRIPSH